MGAIHLFFHTTIGSASLDEGGININKLYSNLRIKHKVLVLISFVMLAVCVSSMSIMQYVFNNYDKEIYAHSSQSLLVSSYGIENELIHLENLSFRLATDSVIQSYLKIISEENTNYDHFITSSDLRKRMLELGASEKFVISMQVFDIDDFEHGTGMRPITTSAPKLEKIKSIADEGQGAVRWVFPDEKDEALIAAREIRSYQHLELKHLGYLAVRINIDKLFANYSRGLDKEGAHLMVMSDEELVFPNEVPESFMQLNSQLARTEGYTILKLDGKRYFITHVPSNYTNWTYMILIPYDTIFRTIITVKNLVILFFALIFVLALVLSVRFSKGVTGPIESLNAKMKRVQLGHFSIEDEDDVKLLPMDEAGQMHRNFRIMLQRIDELINENLQKQLMIHESEFKALQAQINPHFLYNTLESINWLSKLAGQQHISQMVESLGFLLRSSISNKKQVVTLKEEMAIVQHYITIQKVRFEERLEFHTRIPEQLGQCFIPKLTLQPLVENAIQHALEQMIETCVIHIEAFEQDGQIIITVEDNGPGIGEDVLENWQLGTAAVKGTGIGLRNIHERIRFMHGKAYGLELSSKRNSGTKVTVIIPQEWEEKQDV